MTRHVENGHEIYETSDPGAPHTIKDQNGEVVLALCVRCGKGEAELDGPCIPKHPPRVGVRVHRLRTWPAYFDAVEAGTKPFEVRKNDRDFHVGDLLLLLRWEPLRKRYTMDADGVFRMVFRRVTYVLHGGGTLGLAEGYVVLGLEPVHWGSAP